jgi:hypothetical protein
MNCDTFSVVPSVVYDKVKNVLFHWPTKMYFRKSPDPVSLNDVCVDQMSVGQNVFDRKIRHLFSQKIYRKFETIELKRISIFANFIFKSKFN